MFRLALLAFVTALAWLVFAWSDGNQLFTTSFLPVTLHHLAIGHAELDVRVVAVHLFATRRVRLPLPVRCALHLRYRLAVVDLRKPLAAWKAGETGLLFADGARIDRCR